MEHYGHPIRNRGINTDLGAMMDDSVKCGNCRFFHNGDMYNYCRKNARKDGGWPEVGESSWCGEFKRKFIHEEDNRNLDPDKLVTRKCGHCLHARIEAKPGEAIPEHPKYICTYNPPVMLVANLDNVYTKAHTMFPHVDYESLCSKFRVKEIIIEEKPQNILTPGKRAITLGDS